MAEIVLRDLKLAVCIGCTGDERAFPQLLTLQVAYQFDGRRAGNTDLVSDSIDYMEVADCLGSITSSRSWNTVEGLGATCINEMLARFPKIEGIKITIAKNVVINAGCVECTMQYGSYDRR